MHGRDGASIDLSWGKVLVSNHNIFRSDMLLSKNGFEPIKQWMTDFVVFDKAKLREWRHP